MCFPLWTKGQGVCVVSFRQIDDVLLSVVD